MPPSPSLSEQDVFAKVLARAAQRRTVFGSWSGEDVGGSHSVVDRLKLFRQVGMTGPESVQVFGMGRPITVATFGHNTR